MPCYHPLKAFIVGYKDNGKKDIKVTSYETDHIELNGNGQYIERPSRDLPLVGKPFYDYDTIPCGRCIGCRLQRSKSWADRAVLELPYHDSNLFITLTYDDDHLPHNKAFDDEGNIIMTETLKKKDLQDFWKRLRKYCDSKGEKIRYLACGEYGDITFRPHYHAIVFGLSLPDLEPKFKNELGDWIYTSETLSGIWKNGLCSVGEATHESIAYVARYVTKKKYGKEAELYEKLNIVPEFINMSRKPGLGREYYEENKDKLFTQTKYFFPIRDGVGSATPGRYFSNLFELDYDSESVQSRKDKLKGLYEDRVKLSLSKTDKNYLDYLSSQEYIKENRTKSLVRNQL